MPRGQREGTMPSYWIVKTEPSTYSYDDLARQKTAVWDGVKNNLALKHLRSMRPGDQVLVYHTGDENAVVDLKARERLPRAVPLAEIKGDRAFADLALVRIGRLSVMPASADQFQRLLKLGGAK